MDRIIKIVLIVLLFGCLLNLPYGYYQFVRFIAMAGFSYLAFESFQNDNNKYFYVHVILVMLFQPFVKVALGRNIWNFVDVIVAIWLITTIISTKKN